MLIVVCSSVSFFWGGYGVGGYIDVFLGILGLGLGIGVGISIGLSIGVGGRDGWYVGDIGDGWCRWYWVVDGSSGLVVVEYYFGYVYCLVFI